MLEVFFQLVPLTRRENSCRIGRISMNFAPRFARSSRLRIVPRRALWRAIRFTDKRHGFRDAVVHDRAYWIDRDQLTQSLSPAELGLGENEPSRLLLIAEPTTTIGPATWLHVWRELFHAAVDREFDAALQSGRIDASKLIRLPRDLGPAAWHAIRGVLEEEHLILEDDDSVAVARELVAFGCELIHFCPNDWDVFFPGIRPNDDSLGWLFSFMDAGQIFEKIRPEPAKLHIRSSELVDQEIPGHPVAISEADRGRVRTWAERGNDVCAAILLQRGGDSGAIERLDRLIDRLRPVVDLDAEAIAQWREAFHWLLPPAAASGWPAERRLLYELQRACLAIERPAFAADVIEWMVTLGRRPVKRELPRTKWVEAHRRFLAAKRYAGRIGRSNQADRITELVEHAAAEVEHRARNDLRPAIIATLDEVGLVPASVAERVSRDKLVEELLDGACSRGFLRIGDLRDAIARNRVKLPDLKNAGEWIHGDALIRANRLLAVRLDGVYRRGEVYMRALQRGCSLFFGTAPGRLFTRFVALPFGGSFILIEAIRHMVGAGEGLVNWLSGWSATVKGFNMLAGGAAGTLADNPDLGNKGITWQEWLVVGVLLFLLMHWPAFRNRAIQAAKWIFVKLPRAISRSPLIHALIANRVTRFVRRYLMTPLLVGILFGGAIELITRDWPSALLVASGAALFVGAFLRTPLGRIFEDHVDEAASRIWRLVSVNFLLGLLTLILHFFQAIFEAIDRAIYAVDEWLRFRPGQSRAVFVFKVGFGAFWFVVTYVFRFAWNLLVEPQINPIKHFPVVTVSHKLLLPLIPSLAKQFQISEKTMGTIVFGIPGIFGFLVWELRENWKLYRANSSPTIRPAMVGARRNGACPAPPGFSFRRRTQDVRQVAQVSPLRKSGIGIEVPASTGTRGRRRAPPC